MYKMFLPEIWQHKPRCMIYSQSSSGNDCHTAAYASSFVYVCCGSWTHYVKADFHWEFFCSRMEKYSAFSSIWLVIIDFYTRGLKRKLNIAQLFFLSASFFSFVFSAASKNTPNGNRPLCVRFSASFFWLYVKHTYKYLCVICVICVREKWNTLKRRELTYLWVD